jgi:SAM-dependent methyltransferase
VPELDRDTAREWIERWDRQQEEGLADREDRFTALIDAVEEGTGRPDPLILDIGCGPGSLGIRLLARLPRATVIGIDADPVSLTLGRAAYSDVPGLRFADLDLRLPGWAARLGLGTRAPDAAVSTTALHWLPEPELRAVYAELASVLRPGGLLLDGVGQMLGYAVGADEALRVDLVCFESHRVERNARESGPPGARPA